MTAGAVLAGGASRRMGRDKALIEVAGTAMVARVAGVLESAGCGPVVVVGGDEAAIIGLGLPMVADLWAGAGPLGAIITALRWAEGPVVVAACDLPDLSVEAVRAVAGDHPSGGGDTSVDVVVATTGRLEPLLSRWNPSALGVLEERFLRRGERAVHRVLDGHGHTGSASGPARELVVRRVPVDPSALRNVNQPGDLADGAPG